MKMLSVWITALALITPAWAKLPAPDDAAKAQAAEAAAKAAHAGKLDAYQLCKAQDRVVARTKQAASKPAVKSNKGAPASSCVDPGAFVYMPAGADSASAAPKVAASTQALSTSKAAAPKK
jgi:hypothetical protein